MNQQKGDRVECYSGFTFAQRPKVLVLDEERYPIDEILEEWKSPQGKCFHVRAGEKVYRLDYMEGEDRWEIEAL